jgi:hypothetical protein
VGSRKLVGVIPASAADERRELLTALECVFPVRFQGRQPDDLEGLDGILAVDSGHSEYPAVDGKPARLEYSCPSLTILSGSGGSARSSSMVELSEDEQLARPLRGRVLLEEYAGAPGPPPLSDGERVLALADGRPLWWRREERHGWKHYSRFPLQELGEGEALRDRLRAGHFMGLLPLLHLLRRVCEELAWDERPLRAAFVVDDPNLHRGSYGHLSYSDVIAHARRNGYHVALATVPLDGWLFNGAASRLVKSNPQTLSLLMHGNDHVAGELGRLLDDRAAERVLAQAMRRIASLERRCGVPIERVMAPPHELCSANVLAAMFRLGFEGACIGRRHPWREHGSLPTIAASRLLKWHPTDLLDGGLPIVPRYPIEQSREDLVFRAFLRQPLILFAHHGDFAEGLDLLEQAANEINGLGEVRWGSVGSIARDCFFTRRDAQTLDVQMHSRRIVVEVPAEVRSLHVQTPSLIDSEPQRWLACDGVRMALERGEGSWSSGPLQVSAGGRIELVLESDRPLDPEAVPAPRSAPWPLMRRLLVEGRDRAGALLGR